MAYKITNGTLTVTFDDVSSSEAAALIANLMEAAMETKPDCNFSNSFVLHSQADRDTKKNTTK